jgi:hypothetical protein
MPEHFTEPTCVVCGCTERRACPPTCSWIILDQLDEFGAHGVCSACAKDHGEASVLLSCWRTTQRFPAGNPFHDTAARKLAAARKRRGIAA